MKQWLAVAAVVLSACAGTRPSGKDNGRLTVQWLQVNDVYEIAPLSGGTEGGMARVATVRKTYAARNPNSLLVMAGDFLSPSVYNSVPYEGKAIRGRQMVEVMNAAGFDLACFGNHEFDIREGELQSRLDESRFAWVATNVFHKTKSGLTPFAVNGQPIPPYKILSFTDADGTHARVGVISATLPFNKAAYVSYTDPMVAAQQVYNRIKDSVDVVVALTHQAIADDEKLAAALPTIPVIMGGHEHDQRFEKRGNTTIAKAHANARSLYQIELTIDQNKKRSKIKTRLIYLDEKTPLDSATHAVVQKWVAIADSNFSKAGFQKTRVVQAAGEALDGREIIIRREASNLTKLLVKGMEKAAPEADVALFNAGSIRVDDFLPAPITEYDIIRALPFGGGIREVDMRGSLLSKILDSGRRNLGIGGFLHYSEKLTPSANGWQLAGQLIDPQKNYRVALTDFLLTGGEANLSFLQPNNPDITKVYDAVTVQADSRSDVRLALIRYLMQADKP